MRDFHGSAGKRHKYHTDEKPREFPDHSSCASATVELVYVSPDEFLRLERLGKRRKRKVTLPHVSILD